MCRYVRREAEGTVERLRQAQRRDLGVPFVATVIDQPGDTPPQAHLPGAPTDPHSPDVPTPVTADHGNAAAVAAYVAASQAAADGEESPKHNVFDPQ